MFNAKETKEQLVQWLKDYFEKEATPETKAIIGISGGKDSTIAAALLVEALGKDRVIGVMMPNWECPEQDMADSLKVISILGIQSYLINIGPAVDAVKNTIKSEMEFSEQARINTPPRIRMTTLYAIGACNNGRVVNTCNLSEDYVGYATKFGDGAGDFSLFAELTVTEILAIGDTLDYIPSYLVHKTPADGLCGKTDEDSLGFTYEMLDKYIRGTDDLSSVPDIKNKIDTLHKRNLHKVTQMPRFTT